MLLATVDHGVATDSGARRTRTATGAKWRPMVPAWIPWMRLGPRRPHAHQQHQRPRPTSLVNREAWRVRCTVGGAGRSCATFASIASLGWGNRPVLGCHELTKPPPAVPQLVSRARSLFSTECGKNVRPGRGGTVSTLFLFLLGR